MNTSTSAEEKREKLRLMKEFHRTTFRNIGVDDPYFLPKLAYQPPGINEKVIAFFQSEVGKGQDIYIEFADSDYVPQDPERRLYKWRYNPNYKEEYETTESSTGIIRYFIPVAELILIKANPPEALLEESSQLEIPVFSLEDDSDKSSKAKSKKSSKSPEEDILLKDATIRDLAAILWKQPVSNKPFINEMIQKALR